MSVHERELNWNVGIVKVGLCGLLNRGRRKDLQSHWIDGLGDPFVFPNCFHLFHGKAKMPLFFHGKIYTMETPIPFQICFSFD